MFAARGLRYLYLLALAGVVAFVSTAPAMSQDMVLESTSLEQTAPLQGTALAPDNSIGEDAQWYAEDQGILPGEAARRMKLMESADDLTAKLFANERETFAGIWIQHQPEFRIETRFTHDGEQTIRPYVEGGSLEGLVDVLPASATYEELEVAEARARYLVDGLGIPAESGIDETENLAYINVTDLTSLEAALKTANVPLPEEVKLVEVNELLAPSANIYGGVALRGCTNGLSVVHSSGSTGVTTAGHCSNAQSFRAEPLNFQTEGFAGPYDIQWHKTPFVEQPWVRDSDGIRVIHAAKGRLEYPEDRIACHFGQGGDAAEYTCGYIRNRSYRPPSASYNNPTATFVLVESGGDLEDRGDSGGPWLIGNTALGIHSGGNTAGRAFYMSITYFNDDGPRDFNLVVRKG